MAELVDASGNDNKDLGITGSTGGGVGWRDGHADYSIKRDSSGQPITDSSGNQQKTGDVGV